MTQRRAFHLRTQALAHLAVEEAEGFDLEAEGHGGVQQGGQQALVLHQRVVNAPLLQGQLGQRHRGDTGETKERRRGRDEENEEAFLQL